MIRLTISLPLDAELEAQCKELTLDNSKLPPAVVRQAAMQGVSLAEFKLNKVNYDWGTAHFTFVCDGESEFVTLPPIPFTESNFHPMHGPAQSWWVSMNRAGAEGPNILEPEVIAEVKAALGGLDLTGKEVNYVARGIRGYQIRISRIVLNAPVWIGMDPAQPPRAECGLPKQHATEFKGSAFPADVSSEGVGNTVGSLLDSLSIGSLFD